MGPAADRAQGALREMAGPLLAPDRQTRGADRAGDAGGRPRDAVRHPVRPGAGEAGATAGRGHARASRRLIRASGRARWRRTLDPPPRMTYPSPVRLSVGPAASRPLRLSRRRSCRRRAPEPGPPRLRRCPAAAAARRRPAVSSTEPSGRAGACDRPARARHPPSRSPPRRRLGARRRRRRPRRARARASTTNPPPTSDWPEPGKPAPPAAAAAARARWRARQPPLDAGPDRTPGPPPAGHVSSSEWTGEATPVPAPVPAGAPRGGPVAELHRAGRLRAACGSAGDGPADPPRPGADPGPEARTESGGTTTAECRQDGRAGSCPRRSCVVLLLVIGGGGIVLAEQGRQLDARVSRTTPRQRNRRPRRARRPTNVLQGRPGLRTRRGGPDHQRRHRPCQLELRCRSTAPASSRSTSSSPRCSAATCLSSSSSSTAVPARRTDLPGARVHAPGLHPA